MVLRKHSHEHRAPAHSDVRTRGRASVRGGRSAGKATPFPARVRSRPGGRISEQSKCLPVPGLTSFDSLFVQSEPGTVQPTVQSPPVPANAPLSLTVS